MAGGLTERQMLQLALEESKNAALAAAAGKSGDSSEEENSDSDSDDGSSAQGAKTGGGKPRRAKSNQKSRTQKASGSVPLSCYCKHRRLIGIFIWRLMNEPLKVFHKMLHLFTAPFH